MKRFIALLLCACFAVLLSSCEHAEKVKQRQKEKFSISSEEAASRLAEANKHRSGYDFGELRKLRGNIAVAVFFMNDEESSWEGRSTDEFIGNEITPALNFLKSYADNYKFWLNFELVETHVCDYDGKITRYTESGGVTGDAFDCSAEELGYESDKAMIKALNEKYQREVIPIVVVNKNDNSYAITPPRGDDTLIY